MYLATVWYLDRIHFDYLSATVQGGLLNIVAPGTIAVDYYVQLLTGWTGHKGELKKLSTQYLNFMAPENTPECGGKITHKCEEEGRGEGPLRKERKDGSNRE